MRFQLLKEIKEDELPALGEAILFVIGEKYPGLQRATLQFDHFYERSEPDEISADIEFRTWPDGVRAVITAEWIYAQRPDQADDDQGEYTVARVDFTWRSLTRLPNAKYWFERGPELVRSYTFYVFGERRQDFEILSIKTKFASKLEAIPA